MSRPEPAQDPIPLRAGRLSAEVEGADLVSVRWGGTEIASRILVTVRDERWGTVPSLVRRTNVEARADGVTAHVDGAHEDRDIKFAWGYTVEMHADGLLTLTFHGHVLRDFAFRRIGVCVLHPWLTYVGATYRAITPDGVLEGSFPREISPQLLRDGSYQPMIDAFSELHVALPDGVAVDMTLEGELFELEDQRNWTDASFKTYPTPLARSASRRMRTGDRVEQRVSLRIGGVPTQARTDEGPVVIRIGGPTGARMPRVGLMLPPEPIAAGEMESLHALGPAHVRGELLSPDVESLARLAERAAAIGAPLELALLVDENRPDVSPLAPALDGVPLARLLVHLRSGATIPCSLVESVREQLGSVIGSVPVAGGTWSHFSELNRLHPDPVGINEVSFSMSPQVHAFDERSMMETLEIQAQVVGCARAFAGELPIVVSPVSLVPHEPGRSDRDPRVTQPFGSAWTLGSLASLAPSRVASVTYEAIDGVLAGAVSLRGSDVLDVSISRPREIAAIALGSDQDPVLLLANLTSMPRTVDFGDTVTLDGYGTMRIEL